MKPKLNRMSVCSIPKPPSGPRMLNCGEYCSSSMAWARCHIPSSMLDLLLRDLCSKLLPLATSSDTFFFILQPGYNSIFIVNGHCTVYIVFAYLAQRGPVLLEFVLAIGTWCKCWGCPASRRRWREEEYIPAPSRRWLGTQHADWLSK